MLTSKHDYVYILIIQLLGAGVVLIINYYLLLKVGGKFYLLLSAGFTVFTVINYFDFGLIGHIRRISATSMYSINEKFNLMKNQFIKFIRYILIYEASIWILYLYVDNEIFQNISLALLVAPVMIFANAIRAYYEGRKKILLSNLIRIFFGLTVVSSPLVSHFFLSNYLYYPIVVFIVFLIFLVFHVFKYFNFFSKQKFEKIVSFKNVAKIEMLFMWFGIVLLYYDKFILLYFANTALSGKYVFLIEVATRVSLLYVPLVLMSYPKIVKYYESNSAELKKFLKLAELKLLFIMFIVVIGSILLILFLKEFDYVNNLINKSFTCNLQLQFCVLLIAFGFNSSNYFLQRVVTLTDIQIKKIIILYLILTILTISLFLLLYLKFNIHYLSSIVLLRVVMENVLLRYVLKNVII